MVGCPGWDALGGGLSSVMDKHSYYVGPFFKATGPHGDEVPRPRQPALSSIVVPVGSREEADLARETSSSGLNREEDSPPQVLPHSSLPFWEFF
ncbi:hypothetical protein E2C01_012888 [Portunus trituberculatus]|uniref:Uncharacterized protein n=1 Tax=Portunus trituberculatus TaxID=210409 RepID=A0A5B7DFM7_PORTR|nr:hypothetical protein [Portunus trituberculatus]